MSFSGYFVKVEMLSDGRFVTKRKTKLAKPSGGQVHWGESVLLPITSQDYNIQLSVKLYSRGSIRRKYLLGQVGVKIKGTLGYCVAMSKSERVLISSTRQMCEFDLTLEQEGF